MNQNHLNRKPAMDDDAENDAWHDDDMDVHHAAHSKIGVGARAINRLLWSLWFLLLPFVWPSSDWIGLLILSQAFFVAAKLLQPAVTNANSAASPANAVLTMEEGEDCA
jgi:hypothetical protein